MNKRKIGTRGEELALTYLKNLGYKILDKNWTCHWGEIDIVAQEKQELVFIEVKYRTTTTFGYPNESFTKKKKDTLLKSIFNYLTITKLGAANWRLDLLTIVNYPKLEITHYKSVEV